MSPRRSPEFLPGALYFRYVSGKELFDLKPSLLVLNEQLKSPNPAQLASIDSYEDSYLDVGASVVEKYAPGESSDEAALWVPVGFCFGHRRQEMSLDPHLYELLEEVDPGVPVSWVDGAFLEPNVHINSVVVDPVWRNFLIPDALLYTYLTNRREKQYSLHASNSKAVAAYRRVGGYTFGPIARRSEFGDSLFVGRLPIAKESVLGKLHRVGFTGSPRNLRMERPPASLERIALTKRQREAARRTVELSFDRARYPWRPQERRSR